MAKSVAICNAILNHIVGNAAWSSPAPVFVALNTGNPGDTGANEASSAGASNYARVENGASGWGSASGKAVANSEVITYPQGGDGQNVSHFSLWDAAEGGNFIRGGALTQAFVYGAAVTPEFAIGALTLTES